MSEVINVYDGRIAKTKGGHTVGVVHLDIVTNEGAPERLTGYCRSNYRDAVIKSLKRLSWKVPIAEAPQAQTPTIHSNDVNNPEHDEKTPNIA
ncbi:MAG: hypothetical protein WCJ37_03640 [Syntrophus sp. (in: bacteria)]